MLSRKFVLPALVVLVAFLALGSWLLKRSTEKAAPSGPSLEPSKLAEQAGPASTLESVELTPTPDSRVESKQPAMQRAVATAWYVEMQASPLRAKMREHARVEKWEEKYASFSNEAVRAERDALAKQLAERVKPEMERRFAAGEYEIVSTNGAYTGPSYNTCEVYWVRCEGGKVWKKATLPESGFEDVYKQKALCTWLDEYEHDRPALAAGK